VNTTGSTAAFGGTSGAGSGGDINIAGDAGGSSIIIGGSNLTRYADGGGSVLGGRQRESNTTGTPVNGQLYGGGAPGVYTSTVSSAGGVGAAGVVIVESIY
jgi:hypothetical protein